MSRVQRGHTHGIGHNGANAMTKLLTFHSSVRSDMSDRLISDQEPYIAHLLYITQELKINKKSSAISSVNYSTGSRSRFLEFSIISAIGI